MFPIEMIYTNGSFKTTVLVYSFEPQYNNGTVVDIIVVSWSPSTKTWITCSIDYFEPVINKLLKE